MKLELQLTLERRIGPVAFRVCTEGVGEMPAGGIPAVSNDTYPVSRPVTRSHATEVTDRWKRLSNFVGRTA
jgi:hypothetical protein